MVNDDDDDLVGKQKTDKITIDEWYEEARECKSVRDLRKLMERLMSYPHDYGSITDACIAAALGAVWTINACPAGGITGFQAGWIGMQFLTKWLNIEGPWKRVEYRNMLYPQYEYEFAKVIREDVWKWLQEEAQKKLDEIETDKDKEHYIEPAARIKLHWQNIVMGQVPFGYQVKPEE